MRQLLPYEYAIVNIDIKIKFFNTQFENLLHYLSCWLAIIISQLRTYKVRSTQRPIINIFLPMRSK